MWPGKDGQAHGLDPAAEGARLNGPSFELLERLIDAGETERGRKLFQLAIQFGICCEDCPEIVDKPGDGTLLLLAPGFCSF